MRGNEEFKSRPPTFLLVNVREDERRSKKIRARTERGREGGERDVKKGRNKGTEETERREGGYQEGNPGGRGERRCPPENESQEKGRARSAPRGPEIKKVKRSQTPGDQGVGTEEDGKMGRERKREE